MKRLRSQVFLLVLGVAWSFAASAINGIQVPMAFCITESGHSDHRPPYYGSNGPSPTDWNAAVQLSCIRYAAAHNACGTGSVCVHPNICSVSDTCNLLRPPGLSPLFLPAPSARASSFLMFHQVNTPSCIAVAPEFPGGTCHCPTNAQMATDGNCYCNDGHVWSGAACVLPQACQNVKDGVCQPAAAVAGKNCPTENCAQRGDVTAGTNPINVGTGMKTEHDVLYRSATAQPLSIEMQFVSGNVLAPLTDWTGKLGRNRYSPFDRVVRVLGTFSGFDHAVAVRSNAQRLEFRKPTGSGAWTPDQDVADRLERLSNGSGNPGGWRLTAAGGDEVELYDEASPVAAILSVADRHGRTHKFSYANGSGGIRFASGSPALGFSYTAPACSPPAGWIYQLHSDGTNAGNPPLGRLLCVTDHWGRKLHFQHDPQGRVRRIADPAGQVYQFHYDGASAGCSPHSFENAACSTGVLTSVVLPDAKVRTYHYNETSQISNGGSACSGTPTAPGRSILPTHMTGLEDENGVMFARWTYDCNGRATSSQHAGGANKITIVYDTFSSQRTVTDYRSDPSTPNQSRTYTYATAFGTVRNTSLTVPCDYCGGAAAALTYDANGNPASRTDFNGNRTNYTHDLARNLETSRTEGLTAGGGVTPQTRTISTQWHPTFRLPTGIAEPLRITTLTYDSAGNVLARSIQPTSDASGSQGFSAAPNGAARAWTYTYNANGFVLTVNGPRLDVANVTTYTYDAQDRVETITNAAGHTTTVSAYNAHGQPLTIVDPNGLISTLTYDERQRLKTRTVGGELTTYDYDGVGQLTKVTLPDGSFLEYTYDPAHRLTGMQDNLGNRIAYTLDLMGKRTAEEVRDPANQLAQTRSRVFNNLSRLFQELGAQGQTTEYSYDTQGNVLTVKDPLNRITTNQYDALNRLRQVTSPAPISAVTQYAYNGLDALTQVTDPRGLVTGYAVDGLGNLNVQSSPDTGPTTNTHDIAGNLLTQTDAKGQTTTYAYDALNRVTLITFHDGSKQAYAYDQGANGIGRLSSITETNPALQVTSVIAYAYDLHGRVLSETRTVAGVQHVLAYSYDSFGRLTGLTYPSGRTVVYSFDGLGRVSAVTTTKPGEQAQTVVSNVAYHPFGGVKGYTLGNGQAYTRGIDLDGRIASYTLGTQAFAIGYDPASRISFITDVGTPANTNTYGYDNLDRLTSAVLPGTPYAYSYDAVGNRTSKTAGSGTDTYAYSGTSNRIASITPSSGPLRSFVFDANGSTTADGNNTYAYDVRGRMVQATSSIGATNYQVNALGQRIRKTNSLGDTVFHYDTQGRLIAETGPAGTLVREYVYLGDIPVLVSRPGSSVRAEIILDNATASFSATGTWPTSTAVAGFVGPNYQSHQANGAPPGAIVVDNNDAGFSVTGTWPSSTSVSGYFGTDYRVHTPNGEPPSSVVSDNASGAALGTWPASTAVSGYHGANYQGHAAGTGTSTFTWTLNVPSAGTYEVRARWTAHPNRATNAKYTVNHAGGATLVTTNMQQGGGQWNSLGSFTFNAGATTVSLSDDADGYVIADAVLIVPPGAAPNTATWTLIVPSSAQYKVYARWTQHANRATNAPYTVNHAAGATTVRVNQEAGGGAWSLLGTFGFDAGTATVTLTDQANEYVIADAVMLAPLDAAPNTATWTPNAQPGQYEIYARWTQHANRATNATYSVTHAGGATAVTLNQQQGGGAWNLLGTFTLSPGTVHNIALTDQANGFVIADAIRLVPISVPSGSQYFFAQVDHLNTPRLVANDQQQAVWRWDQQEPFGVNVPDENPSGLGTFEFAMRFPGQYFDKETNLHYNYFRDYDPFIGRYVQSDPIGLNGGLNTFLYANASVLRDSDPLGLAVVPGMASCGPEGNWRDRIVPNNPLGFWFQPCCHSHDKCYENCKGPDKLKCDMDACECFNNRCGGRFSQGLCRQIAQEYCYGVMYSERSFEQFERARRKCKGLAMACLPDNRG